MRASSLQVVQLGMRDMDIHCVCTRSQHGDRRHRVAFPLPPWVTLVNEGQNPLTWWAGGENRGTDGLSAPVMVVSEPEQGSLKAH